MLAILMYCGTTIALQISLNAVPYFLGYLNLNDSQVALVVVVAQVTGNSQGLGVR